MPQPSRKGIFFKSEGIYGMRGKKQELILVAVIVIMAALLASCVPFKAEPVQTTFTPAITPQVSCPNSTVSSQVQLSDAQCTQSGQVERYLVDSEMMDGDLYFSVYFPPCYSKAKSGGYPVLYALHGQNFDDGMWTDMGAAETADALILSGDVEPFLIVMPYEEFFFRKVEGNSFPLALIEEIIPWVDENLNVCAEKACRAIGGISRGASWAIRIGFTEKDYFGSIGAHSVPVFRGDITRLSYWVEMISYNEEQRIYLDIGRSDPEVKAASSFENALNEKNVPHEWHLNVGNHSEAYWEAHMVEYLKWYADGWK